MTDHLQEAKEWLDMGMKQKDPANSKDSREHAAAHALIAIAEQLEKIGDRVVIQTDGYSMDDIVKIIDAYKENK